jgi:hypothetical protein
VCHNGDLIVTLNTHQPVDQIRMKTNIFCGFVSRIDFYRTNESETDYVRSFNTKS